MNEATENALNALAGGKTSGGNAGDQTDWKTKFEEMERKFNSAMVEQGRVKKLDESNKELRRKLDEALAARQTRSVIDDLPESVKQDIAPDVLEANAEIALRASSKSSENLRNELRGEIDALKEQFSQRREQETAASRTKFAERLEREFPGFMESAVLQDGDKHAAWEEYQKRNRQTIESAVQTFDFDTLAWHIKSFYTNALGIAPPSGDSRVAADPSIKGGGTPVVTKPGKVYTQQEISDLYDEVERARDRGDFSEVSRIGSEIDKAMREGRVK